MVAGKRNWPITPPSRDVSLPLAVGTDGPVCIRRSFLLSLRVEGWDHLYWSAVLSLGCLGPLGHVSILTLASAMYSLYLSGCSQKEKAC